MDPNAPIMSPEEYDALVRTVVGEAGKEPDTGKQAVAAVALNRLMSGRYGSSMKDVLFAPNQFEPWQTRAQELWSIPQNSSAYQAAAQAVNAALQGADPTQGATHFYAPDAQAALGRSAPAWARGEGVQIGNHLFYAPQGRIGSGQTTMAQAKTDSGPSDDDLLQLYTKPPSKPAASPQAPSQAQPATTDDDLLQLYLKPSRGAETPQAPVVGGKPFTDNRKEWNAGLAAANGGILGAGPSLMAAVQATKEKLLHGGDWSNLYDQAKGIYSDAREAYKTEHPVANALAEGAGAIPATVGATVAAAPLAAAAVPARALPFFAGVGTPTAIGGGASAVVGGALQGGLAGALTTGLNYDPSKSLGANVGQNALMGAAGGAILNPVGNVVAKGVSAAWPYAPGRDMANKLLSLTGPQGVREAADAMATNPRLTAMDVDPNALSLGQGLAAQPGEPRKVISDMVQARAASAPAAREAAFDLALGPTPDTKALLDSMKAKARLTGAVEIGGALKGAKPVDLSGVIANIDGKLAPGVNSTVNTQIGATDAQKQLASIRNDLVGPDGNILTDPSRLHQIQSQLRTQADTLAKSSNGQDRLVAGDMRNIRSQIVDAIDAASGGKYKPAQKQYADDMQIQEAFDKGLSLFKSSANDIENRPEWWRDAIKGMSPAEVEAVKQGARVAVNSAVNETRQAVSKGANLAEIPFNQERLSVVLGKDEASRLAKAMADERAIASTNGALMSGSQTQMRKEAADAIRVRDGAGKVNPWEAAPFLPELISLGIGQNNLASHGMAALGVGASLGRRAYNAAGRASDKASNLLLARTLAQSGPDAVTAMRQILQNAQPENRLMNLGGALAGPLIAPVNQVYQLPVTANGR